MMLSRQRRFRYIPRLHPPFLLRFLHPLAAMNTPPRH